MENGKKSNSVITTELKGNVLSFNVLGAGKLDLDLDRLGAAVKMRAVMHGMKQRVSDAAAIPRNTETGLAASPAEKFEAMKALVDHYMSGTNEWSPVRTTGGGAKKDEGLTLAAMRRVWPDRDAEATVEAIAQKRGIDRRAALALFAQTKEVGAAIAAIKAERATVSADDLLDEMND
jgi:hypothetical protein